MSINGRPARLTHLPEIGPDPGQVVGFLTEFKSSPAEGTRQASHPASVVLEFSDVLSIPTLAPNS
jgi:hypothetical protein